VTDTLTIEMTKVLLRMEMLSFGATQAWNASGGHSGEPDDRMVSMILRAEDPPHITYRIRFNAAVSEDSRKTIYKEAKDELNAWVKRDDKTRGTLKSFDEVIIEDGKGWEPEMVARRYPGLTARRVRSIRKNKKLDTETGKEMQTAVLDHAERPDRARDMRARGMSTRQIADAIGVHQTQVMRWIRASSGGSE
jgi:DNA invertase Pin-like site-specific DNA recombinase